MYFESHAHYDDKRYNADREELLAALPYSGVDFCINAGADMRSSRFGVALAEKHDYIYASVGVHPHSAKELTDEKLNELKRLCAHPKVVAIGETGLDFYYDHSPRDTQRRWFKKQLDAAIDLNMPVIIHSRESAKECFDTIKDYAGKGLRGVVHCYSGGAEMALDYVKLGFYIGIGGVVTFPKVRQLTAAVEALPAERILIETDCPYLSPAPERGERNDSRNLKYIVEKIAAIKNISPAEIAAVTKANAVKLFFNQKNIAEMLRSC